ncbi:MAG: hypothetical protein HY885_17395 [Deltaproteobacteria bacterium]|nr:hypothetical protein [Deltaproteobacteria bacterium]
MAEINPIPNVDINPIKERIFFEIEESVQDTFWEYHSELKPLEISNWRASLRNGFNSAFKEFNIVNTKDEAQLIFRIYDATPARTLASLSQSEQQLYPFRVSETVKTVVVSSQLTYKVRLLNVQGEILKRSNGTANSKKSGTTKYENDQIIASAIESMYESIAKDFFQDMPVK